MSKIIRNMVSTGSLNDRFISELLSRSCSANEEGTEMYFTVQLCCATLDVEIHVEKGDNHYDDDGKYVYTDYTVSYFTIRRGEEAA